MSDLDTHMPADLMPLVSDAWASHFRWRGQGPMPPDELRQARRLRGPRMPRRRVRFWAIPSNRTVWTELADAGVDLINADDLPGLAVTRAQGCW